MTKKPQTPQRVTLSGEFPQNVPQIPADARDRFPSLAKWHEELDRWWFEFRSVMQRRDLELNDPSLKLESLESSTNASITSINEQLVSLSQQLAQIAGQGQLFVTPEQLAQAIQSLSAALSAHINSTTAHGTTSRIVGEMDEQPLERKTIGLIEPRYGRFSHLIGGSDIHFTESVVIPFGYYMVVGGPMTVNGSLHVEGTLAMV